MLTTRPLALGGVVGPVAFVTAWAVCGARTDGYDPVDQAISQLASVHAPARAGMTAGLLAFAVGVVGFGLALRRVLPGPAWLSAVLTGVATLGVAALPLDGPAGDDVHGAFAVAGYATLASAPLLAAGPFAERGLTTGARVSVVCGVVSAACLTATTIDPVSGLAQRAGLTAGDAWIVVTALAVWRDRLSRA